MTSPLVYYNKRYCCYTLLCGAFPANLFGCCNENTAKCAEIYWVGCCPCRCAFGIVFGSLGAICDVCTIPWHCYGNPKCVKCVGNWCGCECIAEPRLSDYHDSVIVTTAEWHPIQINNCSQLIYFLCCVHGTCWVSGIVKHCRQCEPTIPVAPAPSAPPIPSVPVMAR